MKMLRPFKSKYAYVCPVNYYPNCRAHDGGYYNQLKFFKSLRDLLNWALKNIDELEIDEIYTITGHESANIAYEISRHRATGLVFQCKYLKLRTVDNGSGQLIWTRL